MTEARVDAMTLELRDPKVATGKDYAVRILEPTEIQIDYPSIWVDEADPEVRERLSILAMAIIGEDLTSHPNRILFTSETAIKRVVAAFALLGVDHKLVIRKASFSA